MKKSFPVLCFSTAVLVVCTLASHAALVGVEPFAYTNGPIAGKSAGTYWNAQNIAPFTYTGNASDWNNVSGAPLVMSGRLVTDDTSALREYHGTNEANGAVNEFNVNKQVYYRVTVTTGPVLPTFFGLSSYDFGSERVFFGKRSGQPNFGIEALDDGLGTNSAVTILPNTTYVLVARLDFDDNLVRLYVNPNLGGSEPATATASASYNNTFWSTAVRLASGGGGAVTWDNLVVANEWENLRTLVTTTVDKDGGGAGFSLREAVKLSFNGAMIAFDSSLNGATITLTNEIIFNIHAAIDASGLPSGLTINGGPDTNRIFTVANGRAATLAGLTFTDGNGGASMDGSGGAIFSDNSSTLDLTRCTFTNNSAFRNGGAVLNFGTLTVSDCTFISNTAALQGGAIQNEEVMTMRNCTLSGNRAGAYGGALEILDRTFLSHCTMVGNVGGHGGGISSYGTVLSITNSIIAGNDAETGADVLLEDSTLVSQGANIIQSVGNFGNVTNIGPAPINASPLLAPPGHYGGKTHTMPPLPGSPALNAATVAVDTIDQRGFQRPSGDAADIGAVEVQSFLQNLIYDSFGFESPAFTVGTLEGQDIANGPWVKTPGAATATVQNTNAAAGAQAVRVTRNGSDTRFAVRKTLSNVGASTTPIIAVEWMMKFQDANLPLEGYGPLFGIEVYDDVGNPALLAASATVDATTWELLYQEPVSGILSAVPGVFVSPETWHSYRLELDYSSQTYRIFLDGTQVWTNAFVDPGIADFTDASIATIAGAGNPISVNASGTAFFDNYKVTAQSTGAQFLSLQKTDHNHAMLSWSPSLSGELLLESSTLSPAAWTLTSNGSTNPVTVSTVSNRFYQVYRP